MTGTASAPGKLFVAGEYAVLGGAPALVVAVDRYASLRVALGDAHGPLVVDSVAEGVRRAVIDPSAGPLPGGDVGVVLAAFRVTSAQRPALARVGAEVMVDSRPFLSGAHKLGLGRSAATLVASVAALLAAAGDFAEAAALDAAVAGNALFQDGRGSSADVAAAVHGGLIEVRRRDGTLAVTRRALPAGLHLVAGWTGESAATAPLLARFSTAVVRAPEALRDLAAAAERAAGALAEGDTGALLDAVAASAGLLEALGRATELPIVTPALGRLVAAATRVGAAAKPSGAGGGDCGIALATSAAQADAVREAWRAEGIVPLPLGVSARGVSVG